MLLTEAEAKTKWCPFVRLVGGAQAADTTGGADVSSGVSGYNRVLISGSSNYLTPHAGRCVASECMAWRWGPESQPKWEVTFEGEKQEWNWDPSNHSAYKDRVKDVKRADVGRTGRCGLAGGMVG